MSGEQMASNVAGEKKRPSTNDNYDEQQQVTWPGDKIHQFVNRSTQGG